MKGQSKHNLIKKLSVISIFCLLILLINPLAAASEAELKSETLAYVLAFDPLPGDALFYAGKSIQGTINSVIGGLSGFAFVYALHGLNVGCESSGESSADPGDCRGIAKAVALGGALLYFPALIWDAIGGITGVKNYNKKVLEAKQQSELSVRLSLDYKWGRALIGAEFNF